MSGVNLRALALLMALPVVLAACAGRPLRPGLPPEQLPAAQAAQQAREASLRRQPQWSLAGRIAVANDGKGGSGRLEWQQHGPRFEVALSAPVTRQSWRLSGDASQARLEGLDGGTRQGTDARQLLLEATGWDIPVVALADWVRGLRSGSAPAAITYGGDGFPARIIQGGWQIDYTWPAAGPAPGADVLPARIDARQGEARVRLIVDQWGGSEAGG